MRTPLIHRVAAVWIACTAMISNVDAISAEPQANPPRQPSRSPTPKDQHPALVLGPPPVTFEPALLDLGDLRPNQRVHGIVNIHNTSSKWLHVKRVQPDCTCTGARMLDTNMIEPGKSAQVEVEYHANAAMGEWKGAVRVLIEGYDMIELPTRAFISMPVRAEPPFISAIADQTGELALSGEYTVKSNDGRPFRIHTVNGEPAAILNFNPDADAPRNSYVLRWDFTGYDKQTCMDKNGRRLPGWFVIETDHPDCPIFDMEVRHDCVRRKIQQSDTWAIQEKRVMIGAVKGGEAVEFEVGVRWIRAAGPRGREFVHQAVSQSPHFTVNLLNVQPTNEGFTCRLRLTPSADYKGLLQGNIRLVTGSQSSELLITGLVQ